MEDHDQENEDESDHNSDDDDDADADADPDGDDQNEGDEEVDGDADGDGKPSVLSRLVQILTNLLHQIPNNQQSPTARDQAQKNLKMSGHVQN